MDEWINKMWSVTQGNVVQHKKELLPPATAQMNLEDVLGEISQPRKRQTMYDSSYLRDLD